MGAKSDSITLINFQPDRASADVQIAVTFPVGTIFILLADEIKIISINGKSRPAKALRRPAGIVPFAQRGRGVILVDHLTFLAAWVLKLQILSHGADQTQYKKYELRIIRRGKIAMDKHGKKRRLSSEIFLGRGRFPARHFSPEAAMTGAAARSPIPRRSTSLL